MAKQQEVRQQEFIRELTELCEKYNARLVGNVFGQLVAGVDGGDPFDVPPQTPEWRNRSQP
jgi:hypothetical protein